MKNHRAKLFDRNILFRVININVIYMTVLFLKG